MLFRSVSQSRYRFDDFIKNIEYMCGVDPENSFPKIYYNPKKVVLIDGIIEVSAISLKYDPDSVRKKVEDIKAAFPNTNFGQMCTMHGNDVFKDASVIPSFTVEEACDILFSCNVLITLSSGIHSLAAAIRRKRKFQHICLLPEKDHEWIMSSKKFVYPEIEYLKA